MHDRPVRMQQQLLLPAGHPQLGAGRQRLRHARHELRA
jgi:hypothetical protein